MKTIEPRILRGTRDFTPQQMASRNNVMDIMRNCFEQFGYASVETPILSLAETILGKYGDEGDKLTYAFTDRGGRKIALPYDLTVPFARYLAANYRELPIPFKRYQMQRVWRAERPQKGRYREFYQCDIDIIGGKDLICEAEVTKLISIVFDRLGINNIKIKINSRRLLNEILAGFGASDNEIPEVLRIIDKLYKIGEQAVINELQALGVKNSQQIISILQTADTNQNTLQKLSGFDTAELENFLQLCKILKVPDEIIEIDPTLARGLDYYTGLIFEVVCSDFGYGSICAGGRYDNLCSMFSDKEFSGIGVAFGFERIMLILEEQGKLAAKNASSNAMVAVMDNNQTAAINILNSLIDADIPAEIYLGSEKLAKQLKFANKKAIPFVILQNADEMTKNIAKIRRMDDGEQITLSTDQIAEYIKSNINNATAKDMGNILCRA